MRKISFFTLILFAVGISAQGTGDESKHASKYIPKIAPPSPEAFKFGNYGNIPIGFFTGSPNIDIPLTTFNSGNISIPISLNYSSNGIKIDEMNGSVGLGWTLISAGVITRIVRGVADEKNTSAKTVPDIEQLGTGHPDVIDYLKDCQYSDGRLDSEPDLYTANFGGNSIKFIFDKNNQPVLYSKKNYVIERIVTEGNIFTFSVTLDNGIKFYFSEQETVTNTVQGGDQSQQMSNVSAWYLSKITDTNGQQVNVEYYDTEYYTTLTRSQTMLYTPPGSIQWKLRDVSHDVGYPLCTEELYTIPAVSGIGPIVPSNQHVYGKQIKRIYNKDLNNNILNEIYFTYNFPTSPTSKDFNSLKEISQNYKGRPINGFNFVYDNTSNGRLFLKTITNKVDFSEYNFEYLNQNDLPERLSYERDYWGLYNGKNNYHLIPQLFDQNDPNAVKYDGADQTFNKDTGYYGLLNRIIYPTGGDTELIYEPHKKIETEIVPGPKQDIFLNGSTGYQHSSTKTIRITPKKDEFIRFYAFVSANEDCHNTESSRSSLSVTEGNNEPVDIFEYSSTANTYLLAETYQNGSLLIVPNFNTEFYLNLKKDVPVTLNLEIFRCSASTIHFSYTYDYDTPQVVQKPFGGFRVESTIDTPIFGSPVTKYYKYPSYATEIRKPYFLELQSTRSYCLGLFNDLNYFSLTSSNINQLMSFHPNIFYGTVTEEILGKGKTVHYFNTDTDGSGNPFMGKDIANAQWTNFGWKSGKETLTKYLDESGNRIKEIEYKYEKSREHYVDALAFRKNFDFPITYSSTGFENMDFVHYKNISRFEYLESQTTTDYINGTPLLTTTEYFYNNPSHYQLTDQKTTFPDGSFQFTNYKYTHEKPNQRLIEANMVGIPLITETSRTADNVTKIISKTETIYPTSLPDAQTGNLLLPKSVSSLDLLTGAMATDVTYNQYDSKGNLQQYTTKSGIPTAIVWGYNNMQPIAKIEGATYSQVSSLASAIISASDVDASAGVNNDESSFLSVMKTFRESLPNYQVTTYTYDPLVGVRSITPPNGIRQIYIYDTANRLKEVRENNQSGNLLKEYQYNYKN